MVSYRREEKAFTFEMLPRALDLDGTQRDFLNLVLKSMEKVLAVLEVKGVFKIKKNALDVQLSDRWSKEEAKRESEPGTDRAKFDRDCFFLLREETDYAEHFIS